MLKIAGFVPFTTIDFPKKLSAVIFCQGCPLKCPYCHNPQMHESVEQSDVLWTDVLDFLKTRKGLLDGVVISGGEPLLQKNLFDAIVQLKEIGMQVALHTSGVLPLPLKEVLSLLSWIGLDIKSPFDKYARATGTLEVQKVGEAVCSSLDMILKSGIPFETRTTTDPRVVTKDYILIIAQLLKEKGVTDYALQEYRPANNGRMLEPTESEVQSFYVDVDFLNRVKALFPNVTIRRA